MAVAAAATTPGGYTSPAAERRQRAYAVLDAADPARGRAVRWCETARNMYRQDGHMKEARALLRCALACGAHFPTIYRAWIAMEAGDEGNVAVARTLFEEWRALYAVASADHKGGAGAGGREEEDQGGFWCHYIAFELAHGGAARVRAVAEAAVAACPRDPAVHARYAKAELRLGHADRADAVLGRARLVFAADADAAAWEWLVDDVNGFRDSMRRRRLMKLCSFLPFCRSGGSRSRPAHGYQRLGVA